MTSLDLIPAEPHVLDAAQDPTQAVVALLEQSKLLLAQATRLEDVVEWKARAGALEAYTRQRDLGKEAELSAQEIVRRAERRIGQLIQERQSYGPKSCPDGGTTGQFPSPRTFFAGGRDRDETYKLAQTNDDVFEAAVAEARAEENLSRANVVRKVQQAKPASAPAPAPGKVDKSRVGVAQREDEIRSLAAAGHTTPQIAAKLGVTEDAVARIASRIGVQTASSVLGRVRRVDSNRVVEETVAGADALIFGLDLIDFTELDPECLQRWVDSLSNSLRSLNRLHKQLKETIQ